MKGSDKGGALSWVFKEGLIEEVKLSDLDCKKDYLTRALQADRRAVKIP